MRFRKLIYCLAAFICLHAAAASARCDSVSRPVTQVYSLEVGGVSALDTYLSGLRYSGMNLAVTGLWTKAMPFSPDWTMDFDARMEVGRGLNAAKSSSMFNLTADFHWGMNRRWRLPHRVVIYAGASAGFDAGMLYLPRNANNPADAVVWAGLSLDAALNWPFHIGRLPVLLTRRFVIPTLGAFFKPQYGESYYEIYLGNREGLAHFGWWGNHFCLDSHLALTFDFGRTAMQVGYRFRMRTSYVNHIDTQLFTNAFTIGVIPHGIGLKNRRPCLKTVTVNALY